MKNSQAMATKIQAFFATEAAAAGMYCQLLARLAGAYHLFLDLSS
jgi:hypothetical protein